jgi:hypothetical protein
MEFFALNYNLRGVYIGDLSLQKTHIIATVSLLAFAVFGNTKTTARNTNRRGRLSTVDLLIKIDCFVAYFQCKK